MNLIWREPKWNFDVILWHQVLLKCILKESNNLIHNLYREYKKISDIKLRSNLVADHLNGKYCPRDIPKKDQERYKPSKIFKTMYQKNHNSESRNGEESGHYHTE